MLTLLFLVLQLCVSAQSPQSFKLANTLVAKMPFREQVAQMLMVPAWTRENKTIDLIDSTEGDSFNLLYQIRKLGVGGILFFQGHPLTQTYLYNYYQQESKLPLLIGMDAEWGVAMRLSELEKYPFQLTLGATNNTQLAFATGRSIGLQCKRLGIHINFAPSVDVNTEPNNPIIGFRSFGSTPDAVAAMGSSLMRGMQSSGIYCSAKHFPGHGDTKTDSHKELPILTKPLSYIEKTDLPPFKQLINDGVASVMVAHLKVPAYDTGFLPSSISPLVIKRWLRKEHHFKGLIITDALNMKGVAKIASPAMVAFLALKAGNDIILFPEDVAGFIDLAEQELHKGSIDSAEISHRVKKIIATKYELGLFNNRFVSSHNLMADLAQIKNIFNQKYMVDISAQSIASVVSKPLLVKVNPGFDQAPPETIRSQSNTQSQCLFSPYGDSISVIVIGDSIPFAFSRDLGLYNNFKILTLLQWSDDSTKINSILNNKKAFDTNTNSNSRILIAGFDWPTWGAKSRNIPAVWANTIDKLALHNKTSIYIHFGHSYAIRSLLNQNGSTTILLAHEQNDYSIRESLRSVFGMSNTPGRIPIALPQAETIEYPLSLKNANSDEDFFAPNLKFVLDSMLRYGVERGIFPSAQLLVLKNGKILTHSAVGMVNDLQGHSVPASVDNVYDLASITKIASTTLAIMKLYDEKKYLDLFSPIKTYWPEAKKTPWGSLCLFDLLTHTSGLPAFLPIQQMAKKQGAKCIPCQLSYAPLNHRFESNPNQILENPNPSNLNSETKGSILPNENESADTQYEIGNGVCLENRWKDSAWHWIKQAIPKKDNHYLYSDLNMIVVGKWIEFMTQKNLNDFVQTAFYTPMHLPTMGYLPKTKHIPLRGIAPSLMDSSWCRGEVRGIVHDPSAMLLGGVAGNAGLFSNSMDLGKLLLMLENHGSFQGVQYLKPSTVALFTKIATKTKKKEPTNYRGLGFDKPNGKEGNNANIFENAPLGLFGHSGYTGTWAWADPTNGISFVFLSNRTYPTEYNKKISQEGFRGSLLQAVYERLGEVK